MFSLRASPLNWIRLAIFEIIWRLRKLASGWNKKTRNQFVKLDYNVAIQRQHVFFPKSTKCSRHFRFHFEIWPSKERWKNQLHLHLRYSRWMRFTNISFMLNHLNKQTCKVYNNCLRSDKVRALDENTVANPKPIYNYESNNCISLRNETANWWCERLVR